MGQYSSHRRPTAVPPVEKVQRDDARGELELRVQKSFEKTMEQLSGKPGKKRAFGDLIKKAAK